jgi:hypothetical protein
MANSGKTISQFALTSALENDDKLLIQRGNSYYNVLSKSIGSGALIDITYADAGTLQSAGTLEIGATYYLTDKYIWILAIDNDKFTLDGTFFGRNADYDASGVYSGVTIANGFSVNATGTNLGVWDASLTPASGDIAIWNNLHYLNITGSNGASNPPADAVNWELVANTDIDVADTYGYIYAYDSIEYDFTGDEINRRVDENANDISGGTIDAFRWGCSSCTNNIVAFGGYFPIRNTFGAFSNNQIFGYVLSVEAKTNTTFDNNTLIGRRFEIIDRFGTGNTIQDLVLTGTSSGLETFTITAYGTLQRASSYIGEGGDMSVDVELTATAYAGGTTYTFGDFATSGTITYMYINKDDASGNAPPNATYWVEVFDTTTAGRHKLTISKWFAYANTINLISSSATETIDEIVNDVYHFDVKFTCETGLATTFAQTNYGSLANEGEILASADVVVDGDKAEFGVFERVAVGGTDYVREVYSQTAIL